MTDVLLPRQSTHLPQSRSFEDGFVRPNAVNFALKVGMIWITSIFSTAAITVSSAHADDRETDRFTDVQLLLRQYCFACHGDGADEGNLSLDRFTSSAQASGERELWWKVLKNVRAGVMPPSGDSKPSTQEIQRLNEWIKFDVFGIRPDDPDPGRLTVRRLNRTEYGRTINDLMGVRIDVERLLPADDSGHGFDNVGDALSFSPLLMEKYMKVARMAVTEAVPTQTRVMPIQVFDGDDFSDDQGKTDKSTFNGHDPHHLGLNVDVAESGLFGVSVRIMIDGGFDFDPTQYRLAFSIDGKQRFENQYGWDNDKYIEFDFEEQWTAGSHEFAFDSSPVTSKPLGDGDERGPANVKYEITSVRIEGPFGTTKLVHPPNYERYFHLDEPPTSVDARRTYAAEVLSKFATQAFRTQVPAETLERLVNVAEATYSIPNVSFEMGIARAIEAILTSPRFLFHLEAWPEDGVDTHAEYGRIDEVGLASRLSYVLWSTMPDEELMDLANSGKLREDLPRQLDRMMSDKRSDTFLKSFIGQWLKTRDVTQMSIDPLVVFGVDDEYQRLREQFRGPGTRRRGIDEMSREEQELYARYRELRSLYDRYGVELKEAMRDETEKFVEYVIREDRSLLELIDSDYAFLNERLGEHYAIAGVEGKTLRRVELPPDSPRGGILTQGSMLLVTSNPTRTSPVKRGLFIMENILGTPAPPAPAGVPDLEDSNSKFGERVPTLRELLAVHREDALCASCHARMDPLGLALENFNALGAWRDTENGQPIVPAGELFTGESFENVAQMKKVLREHHASEFYRCLTQKLLTYALGRGIEYTDEHSIDLIVQDLEKSGGKFSSLLRGVVESAPFQKQRYRALVPPSSASNN